MADARETMRGLAGQVRTLEADIREADGIIDMIQETLGERQGDVSLRDVIASEGQRTAGDLLRDQLDEIAASAGLLDTRCDEIKAGQKELKDPARREKIESFYAGKMVAFLRLLDVSNYDPDEVVKINGRIVEGGSDQPRAILAYDLALLHTIHKFGRSFTAPMVIDSPNQQDQDPVAPPQTKLESNLIVETQDHLPTHFECVACSLKINGLSRLTAAGLGQRYKRTRTYDPAEYYGQPEDLLDFEEDNNEPF